MKTFEDKSIGFLFEGAVNSIRMIPIYIYYSDIFLNPLCHSSGRHLNVIPLTHVLIPLNNIFIPRFRLADFLHFRECHLVVQISKH